MTAASLPGQTDLFELLIDGTADAEIIDLVLDLYAGPGGWSQALRLLDPRLHEREVGVEWDAEACATRAAAGHRTVRADVARFVLSRLVGRVTGIIGSPPCQSFSQLGSGAGRKQLDRLLAAIVEVAGGADPDVLLADVDERARHVLQPLAYAARLRPRWVVLEQVPLALPVWEAMVPALTAMGYHVWTGKLNAADYGVPQARIRAFLIASSERPVGPPAPTHDKAGRGGLPRWNTMADALGWAGPLPAERINDQSGSPCDWTWPWQRPATTIAGRGLVGNPGANANRFNGATKSRNDGVKVTPAEAGMLQSFPPDYPWQGTLSKQYEQVGNAVPPLLGAHVLAQVLTPLAGWRQAYEEHAAAALAARGEPEKVTS